MTTGKTDKLSRCNLNVIQENFVPISEELLMEMPLHLNHYAIQSLTWVVEVKATRGDNCSEAHNNVRDLNYFKAYYHNDIIDSELSDKTY